jgi:hypothetical protein
LDWLRTGTCLYAVVAICDLLREQPQRRTAVFIGEGVENLIELHLETHQNDLAQPVDVCRLERLCMNDQA